MALKTAEETCGCGRPRSHGGLRAHAGATMSARRSPQSKRERALRPATVEIGIDPALVEELRVLLEARTKSEAVRRAVVDALARGRATASPSLASAARRAAVGPAAQGAA